MNFLTRSNIEEAIGVLWLIAALIAFGNGYRFWGYILLIKAIFDSICSISFAIAKFLKDKQ